MRHRKSNKRMGRSTAHRLALKRNLVRSLFLSYNESGYIMTTVEKAKFVKPFAEKLITLAKDNTLHNYRRGLKLLDDEDAVKTLFDDIGPAYRERPGGYTRIVRRADKRLGDKATLALFAFVRESAVEAATVAEDAEE
tara:strand:- start:14 stop:427 length:414 start_codon:yes stop_codon:yes gene_type:complete